VKKYLALFATTNASLTKSEFFWGYDIMFTGAQTNLKIKAENFSETSVTTGVLWATCPRSASSGYHADFHEDCYQKHTNPSHNDPYLRV
jgi:hypothetical protein